MRTPNGILRHLLPLCLGLLLLVPVRVSGQDVLEQYEAQRVRERAEEILSIIGERIVPRGPETMATGMDTLTYWTEVDKDESSTRTVESVATPGYERLTWRKVPQSERHWFKRRFGDVEWTSSGMRYETVLDTASTAAIRARMQALYGDPTNTIIDIMRDRQPRGAEYIQFEYWFTLNDSIPFIVLDVSGPFEDGLVFAGDLAYQDLLPEAKRTLVRQVMGVEKAAPFVDYYYSYDREQWFVTGYTGSEYFVRQISRPEITEGRPRLQEWSASNSRSSDYSRSQ